MKLQEFKKVDPKNYDYFDLCYQVYRFLKSPELYQVIEKFDGKYVYVTKTESSYTTKQYFKDLNGNKIIVTKE